MTCLCTWPHANGGLTLASAIGVSGCWVVQNGGLCGMIALIYEDEPFAYMITAEKLVQDIKQT